MQPCYCLNPGDEIRVEEPIVRLGSTERRVFWHAEYSEMAADTAKRTAGAESTHGAAPATTVCIIDFLADEVLDLCVSQLSLCMMATLAATSRECRAAVGRSMPSVVADLISRHSLWQLLGGGYPSFVIRAKFNADPQAGTEVVREMLSVPSLKRLSCFPFDSHITKGWAQVPAYTLLQRPTLEVLSDLTACVPRPPAPPPPPPLPFGDRVPPPPGLLDWLDELLRKTCYKGSPRRSPSTRCTRDASCSCDNCRIHHPDPPGFCARVKLLKEATAAKRSIWVGLAAELMSA